MNFRAVLKVYNGLRQLTDDESALLNTLRAMNDTERELLVESLQPQKPAGKKAAKKRGSKSARASGMAAAIGSSLQRGRKTDDNKCSYQMGDETCDATISDPIHDKSFGYAGYHPFQPPARSAASPSTLANSETGVEDAGSAAQDQGSSIST